MVPAFQSTLTPTPAAASPVLLAYSVMSRTLMQLTPAVCLAANTANAECLVWAKHTASATVATQERPVTEVRKAMVHVYWGVSMCRNDCLSVCTVNRPFLLKIIPVQPLHLVCVSLNIIFHKLLLCCLTAVCT